MSTPSAHRALLPAVAGLIAGCTALAFFYSAAEPWALRGDNKFIHFPMQLEAFRLWVLGIFPVWTDRIWMGYPLLANSETGALYPPFLLGFLVTEEPHLRAFDWTLALHAGVLVAGTFAFLRTVGCRTLTACFGAALTLLAPQIVGLTSYLSAYSAVAWWPWLMVGAERVAVARDRVPGAILLASLPLGLQVLAGYPEMAFYSGCLAVLWILTAPGEISFAARLGRVAALGLAAVMLAGPQLAPTMEIVADTRRGAPQAARALLAIDGMLGDVANPFATDARSPFLGAATLSLAIIALILRAKRSTDLAVIALITGLAALGERTPVYGALSSLPVFDLFRGPYKLYVVAQMIVLWLAALGLERLLTPGLPARARLRAVAAALLAALSLLEYGAAFRSLLPHVQGPHTKIEMSLTDAFRELGSVRTALTDPRRVGSHSPGSEGNAAGLVPPRVFTGSNIFRMGGLPSVIGVEMVRGGGVSLLSPRHEWLDVGYLGPHHMNLLGVDLVLAQGQCRTPSRLGYEATLLGEGLCVLENPTPRPRFELISSYRRATSAEAFLNQARRHPATPIAVAAPEKAELPASAPPPEPLTPSAHSGAVSAGAVDSGPVSSGAVDGGAVDGGAVEVLQYAPGHVKLRIATDDPRLLFVRQSWSAGWSATVDGATAPLYAAGGLFFVVPMPGGEHDLELTYEAPGLRAGLGMGGAWLALALFTAVRALMSRTAGTR